MGNVLEVEFDIPRAFKPLLEPKRTKVFFGGRGGAKSMTFARLLVQRCLAGKERILCTREIQSSIRESVHKLLSDAIYGLGVQSLFEIQDRTILGPNGSEFIFEGLFNNITKIKSMEGVTICWCEEAEVIKERSWEVLIPTIRAMGSEIWISYNPGDELDSTHQQFVIPYMRQIRDKGYYEDNDLFVAKVSWRDNPWFPDELKREKDKLKLSNYSKYLHIWEGECDVSYENSIILPEWIDAAIGAHQAMGWGPIGVKSMGFDPADEGSDDKALAIRHGSVVTMLQTWDTGDLTDAIDLTYDIAYEHQCTDYVYDAIGIGAGVTVDFKRRAASRIRVTPFKASNSVTDPEDKYNDTDSNKNTFRNARAQWAWYLRDRFERTYNAREKGIYSNPDDMISIDPGCDYIPQLKAELVRIQRKRGVSNTLIQLKSKAEMKKDGIESPNLAEALMMAFANRLPNIEMLPEARPVATRRF